MLFIKLYRHNSFRLCFSIGNMSHIWFVWWWSPYSRINKICWSRNLL